MTERLKVARVYAKHLTKKMLEDERFIDVGGVECKKLKAYVSGIAIVKKKDHEKSTRGSSSAAPVVPSVSVPPSRGFFGWM